MGLNTFLPRGIRITHKVEVVEVPLLRNEYVLVRQLADLRTEVVYGKDIT